MRARRARARWCSPLSVIEPAPIVALRIQSTVLTPGSGPLDRVEDWTSRSNPRRPQNCPRLGISKSSIHMPVLDNGDRDGGVSLLTPPFRKRQLCRAGPRRSLRDSRSRRHTTTHILGQSSCLRLPKSCAFAALGAGGQRHWKSRSGQLRACI